MKKTVIVSGLISGFIVSAIMAISIAVYSDNANFEGSMLLGYASMILAFSLIFVAIKNFRDKYNSGVITFGKAFKIGLYVALISSTMYVIVWVIEYYLFIPDFMEKYTDHVLDAARKSGASQAELDKQISEMANYKEMYKNPVFVILLTYTEILPVGLLVSLIAAAILRRKAKPDNQMQTITE